ncbi:hypothetical protein AVO45_02825 [Ruegeria marisrubri]|uniref:Divergent polysaccharide deacetylase n=1 Tax=Ruegeria marisrubri TaxID=1685379 RepID=A0A101CYW7_9RHOB|nr:divergent polysaccharide deacetylase family protein [Ruegeria marisrubri]KUJ85928.1 hypothetical protein AVO45_02825 [Ruegeria marisrubri]
MVRFLGGMIAGTVVVVAIGAVLSLTTPLVRSPDVASSVPETTSLGQDVTDSQVKEPGADADLVELAPHGPQDDKTEADSLTALDESATRPSGRPAVGTMTGDLESPETAVETGVDVATIAPVAPTAPTSLPNSPLEDVQPVVVDSAPALPSVIATESEAEASPESGSETEPESGKPVGTETVDEEAAEAAPVQPPQTETAPAAEPAPEQEPEVQETQQASPSLPRLAPLPQIGGDSAPADGTTPGNRVLPLTDRDTQPEVETQPFIEPIKVYSASFSNPDAKPLMAIVLFDEIGSFGAEALQGLAFPVSIAVNPADPQAEEKLARYRALGFEVLMIADLPKTASAQDAEVSLSVWFEKLPETVGIIEGTETGIHGSRKLAEHVAAIAGATGRGLVTQDSGLNTVQKMAARRGIPSAVVFRDFDGAGQGAQKMRRFLDQAAFRAGQEGAVVMLGRVRPETISALVQWGFDDSSDRVALAPISAVLLKDQQ